MTITKIDGLLYRRMLCGAAQALQNKKEEINSLNVFPVPDGDTGTNMFMTIDAVRTVDRSGISHLGRYAELSAKDMMRAARGNSGVILSLFFRGVAKTFAGHDSADAMLLVAAFRTGAEEARKAVLKPVEGTILTVMRECCSNHTAGAEESLDSLLDSLYDAAYETLKKTPEMLPALKRAKVVDSGGYGFTSLLDGMKRALFDEEGTPEPDAPAVVSGYHVSASQTTNDEADFNDYSADEIKFAFCTECLLNRFPGVSDNKIKSMRSFLAGIGDSVVMTEDDEIIKVHVHTNEPLNVLGRLSKLGDIQFSKIENMKSQHERLTDGSGRGADNEEPLRPYAILTVSNGAGLGDVFRELGADVIIAGGQSMNPSTDDFLKALKNFPAERAIILPNNSNIVLTALQAARLAEGVEVEVVKSVTIPQGISALISFDRDATLKENVENMTSAMSAVKTLTITNAVKGMNGEKLNVRKNQIIGIVDNELKYAADTLDECLVSLAAEIADREIITIYYGKGIKPEEAEHTAAVLAEALGPGHDIMTVCGNQPVYPYIISAE